MPKTPISIRLETDLLDWFKQVAPNGYQVMIQEVLRSYRHDQEHRAQTILGRAQQIFIQYHAKCFWHMRKDLKITLDNLSIIQNGLRKYGGLEGLQLASDLELNNG
jgi:hypothetical protein